MQQPDLELVQLRKVYPGGTVAVEGFDLRVAKGEFITFVGPSGCGKTTSLRMIAGLEEISSGDLLIRGVNVTDVPVERRPTATIFQNYALFPHMTVRENIGFGLCVARRPAAEVRRRVDAILESFELTAVAGQKERALSGGQKQRVALARGLVTEPEILLLDEPLGALDANLRKSIQEELKLLQRNLGITFVFVTHAQAEALSMGDRVVVMNKGRVEQISAPFELYTRPKTRFVARFIGRNTIIEGTLAERGEGRAVVETRFGRLAGVPSFAEAGAGAEAAFVAPSEYVTLAPAGSTVAEDANVIGGTVTALDVVGHVVHVGVRLDDALSVRIEVYRETLPGGIAPGAAVQLSIPPARATVVVG